MSLWSVKNRHTSPLKNVYSILYKLFVVYDLCSPKKPLPVSGPVILPSLSASTKHQGGGVESTDSTYMPSQVCKSFSIPNSIYVSSPLTRTISGYSVIYAMSLEIQCTIDKLIFLLFPYMDMHCSVND